MPLAQEFIDSVANSNLKNVADAPAYYSGLAMGNAVAHQQSMQNIQLAAVGKVSVDSSVIHNGKVGRANQTRRVVRITSCAVRASARRRAPGRSSTSEGNGEQGTEN